ncbi:hypothetical protein Y032_0036g3319 [Ancylostoma ceylanicum]|uniref:Uncharacterized protein n=1 Tax=Ancylostoma ceylanicum TaxID=53326 RepID=A0A016UKJ2_9BILA|nr:hypothetical protein Y032_0036g3319 [Ancylostoma ceylanicum]
MAQAAGILLEEYSTSYERLHFLYVLIVGGPISATDRPQSIRIRNEVATATAMLGAILLEEYACSRRGKQPRGFPINCKQSPIVLNECCNSDAYTW